jgi:diguanylate cyclase (GGDEF)-like protein/putative nucleotidyltransferase with HDIG domain
MPAKVQAYIAAVIGASVPIVLWAATQWAVTELATTVVVVVAAVLLARVKVTLPGINGTMSAGFFIGLIAMVELSFPEALLAGGASTIAQSVWNTKNRPNLARSAFNLAAILISNFAAYRMMHDVLPALGMANQPARILIAATAYFFVNAVLVAGAIMLSEGKPIVVIFREYCLWGYPFYLVGAAIAGVASAMNRTWGWEVTAMTLPVVVVIQQSYKFYLDKLQAEKQHASDMAQLHLRTIEALALAIDAKDDTSQDHLRRVQGFAVEIAKDLGLPESDIEAVRAAALLHDIGKLAVPEHIVGKPGRLTPQESQKLKIHPVVGAEILEQVEFPYPVVPIVRSHHEKWDGSGYPDGLVGEAIPIGARILSVVDALDALATDRPYRRALPLDEAMEQVALDSGKAFDPRVVDALQKRYADLEESTKKNAVSRKRKRLSTNLPVAAGTEAAAGLEGSDQGGFVSSIAAARQEAQFLFEVTNDLGNSLSLTETLSVVASRLEKLIPHDSIAIFINRDKVLKPEYVHGEDFRLLSSLEIPWGEGLSGWAAAHKREILNGNPAVEPSYMNDPAAFSLLRSALAVPLVGDRDDVVGVLTLYRMERDAFTEDSLRVLAKINSKLAMAIANALRFQQAESSATIDALTGLPNARALFGHLDSELARARASESTVAVLVCDLDGFKAVNDRWGHLEGNRVLQIVAAGFRATLRERDYVARMGGDEFVFVLPGILAEDCDKLVPRLEKAARAAGREVTGTDALSVSVGSAVFPAHGSDAEELLSVADKRMYRNKAENKKKYGIPSRSDLAPPVGTTRPPQQSVTVH